MCVQNEGNIVEVMMPYSKIVLAYFEFVKTEMVAGSEAILATITQQKLENN